MRRLLLSLLLISFVATPAFADFASAMQAYQDGDYAAAASEWEQLAEEGSAASMFNLGLIEEGGLGREANAESAFDWFLRAAENGFDRAQFKVAEWLATTPIGDDDEPNLAAARQWYLLAEAQGYIGAKKRRKQLAKRMTPSQIARGDMLAREALKKPDAN
jgi:TPR repeat protein